MKLKYTGGTMVSKIKGRLRPTPIPPARLGRGRRTGIAQVYLRFSTKPDGVNGNEICGRPPPSRKLGCDLEFLKNFLH